MAWTPVPVPVATNADAQTLIDDFLEPNIKEFQELDVVDEVGAADPDLATVRYTYRNWRTDLYFEIWKNFESRLDVGTAMSVDGPAGTITLNSAVLETDDISGRYKFQYFSNQDLEKFINQTLMELNVERPNTAYTSATDMPVLWTGLVVLGTYLKAVHRLLMDNIIWKDRLIFADPAQLQSTLSALYTQDLATYNEMKGKFKRISSLQPLGLSSAYAETPILRYLYTNIEGFWRWGGGQQYG